MNKTFIKTSTILTSLAFLIFASLSYASPRVHSTAKNTTSRIPDRVNIVTDYANVTNDGADSNTDIVTDRMEIRGDIRGLATNKGDNTMYDVVDTKTDIVNIKTDSFDQVRDKAIDSTNRQNTPIANQRDENYHNRDNKTDKIDTTTDTINTVKNNKLKSTTKKQSFFSRFFGGPKKKPSPTEESKVGASQNTYNQNIPQIEDPTE